MRKFAIAEKEPSWEVAESDGTMSAAPESKAMQAFSLLIWAMYEAHKGFVPVAAAMFAGESDEEASIDEYLYSVYLLADWIK